MIDRNFKKECFVSVQIGTLTINAKDLRGAKRHIYEHGIRGNTYTARVIGVKDYEIVEEYLFKYTREGPIFQKQIYSAWKEAKRTAEEKQLNIFLQL